MAHREWFASLATGDAQAEINARMLAAWVRADDGTTLRTLGDVVDYMTKQEHRIEIMRGALEELRTQAAQS